MDEHIASLIGQIRQIETEIERKLGERRKDLKYRLDNRRVIFERAAIEQQRKFKIGLFRFLRKSPLLNILTSPFIYGMIAPFAFLDLSIWIYQRTCFAAWRVPRVNRADYIVFDRHRLAYLNSIQKLNCLYCGYANGLIAMVREVAGRTEQYWCPIKHAIRVRSTHNRYREFAEYGDAEDFLRKSRELRRQLEAEARAANAR